MNVPVPALGTSLSLEAPASRVVSLVSSTTEVRFARWRRARRAMLEGPR